MRMSKLVGERFKQTPSDCVIDSHILMIRGGYMKYVASGIYTQLPALRRVTRKIEAIIREEMDAIDAQEVLLPVTLPGSLWEQSGRFDSVGKELLRFQDRNGQRMVLGMTHEEAAVQAVKEYGASPQRYPFMIYQIQTKSPGRGAPQGRADPRPGVHDEGRLLVPHVAAGPGRMLRALPRSVSQNLPARGASGRLGGGGFRHDGRGSVSHEFMYLTDVGEDSIALCDACGYRANVEVAENVVQNTARAAALRKVATPGVRTIGELCAFLGTAPEHTVKAVVYRAQRDGRLVVLFTRGDMEASEAKITSALGDEIRPATLGDGDALAAGFIGPAGLDAGDAALLYDRSLLGAEDLVCGANEPGFHFMGFSPSRDLGNVSFGDFSKILPGGVCPGCGRAGVRISRGIEVGNIFQLGDKYNPAHGHDLRRRGRFGEAPADGLLRHRCRATGGGGVRGAPRREWPRLADGGRALASGGVLRAGGPGGRARRGRRAVRFADGGGRRGVVRRPGGERGRDVLGGGPDGRAAACDREPEEPGEGGRGDRVPGRRGAGADAPKRRGGGHPGDGGAPVGPVTRIERNPGPSRW